MIRTHNRVGTLFSFGAPGKYLINCEPIREFHKPITPAQY